MSSQIAEVSSLGSEQMVTEVEVASEQEKVTPLKYSS